MSREIFKRAAKQKKRREESEAKAARPAPRATLVKKAARRTATRTAPAPPPKDPFSRVNVDDELTAVKKLEEKDKKKRAADQLKYKQAKDPNSKGMSTKQAAMLREYGPAGRKYYEGK